MTGSTAILPTGHLTQTVSCVLGLTGDCDRIPAHSRCIWTRVSAPTALGPPQLPCSRGAPTGLWGEASLQGDRIAHVRQVCEGPGTAPSVQVCMGGGLVHREERRQQQRRLSLLHALPPWLPPFQLKSQGKLGAEGASRGLILPWGMSCRLALLALHSRRGG